LVLQNQQALTKAHPDLQLAMNEVTEIHSMGNHVTAMLSRSDLLQLGGYAAVEYCGGPSMVFRMGR
jgi:catalase (peroxidase I)